MTERIDAVFEGGVFRPESPVNIVDGARVSLGVELKRAEDDLHDVADLLEDQLIAPREPGVAAPVSLEEVRRLLGKYSGSLADLIVEQRDDR